MKDILLTWIQWSWKWTQAKKIMEKYWDRFSYFEAWGVLRSLKSTDNALWNYVKWVQDKWFLVSWKFIAWLFESYISTLWEKNMLVDSLARDMEQLEALYDKFKDRDYIIISLELSHEQALKRITSRRLCSSCWTVYNLLLSPWLKNCEKCWWDLTIRADEHEDAVNQRLKIFFEQTVPVVEFFDKLWKVYRVDANRSIDEVFEDINKIIEKI